MPALRSDFAVEPLAFAFGGDLRVTAVVELVLAPTFDAALEDEGPLLIPSRPKFMILAGVTGASEGVPVAELLPTVCNGFVSLPCSLPRFWESGEEVGGAGGGIDKSTGEGVSPTTSLIVNALFGGTDDGVFILGIASIAGVDVKEAVPRLCALARFEAVPVLRIGRMAGDCFFRV